MSNPFVTQNNLIHPDVARMLSEKMRSGAEGDFDDETKTEALTISKILDDYAELIDHFGNVMEQSGFLDSPFEHMPVSEDSTN